MGESCRTHVRNAAVYALKSFGQETLRPAKPTSGRARETARVKAGDEAREKKSKRCWLSQLRFRANCLERIPFHGVGLLDDKNSSIVM